MKPKGDHASPDLQPPSGETRRRPLASGEPRWAHLSDDNTASSSVASHSGLIRLAELLAAQAAREAMHADLRANADEPQRSPMPNNVPPKKGD